MNRDVVRGLVNILMESPIYLELSVKERYRLLKHFLELYVSLPDTLSASPDGEERSPGVRGKSGTGS